MGEVDCVLGAVVSVVVAMLAAEPLCWQHEPFNAQLNPIGGMVGSLPKPPPIGLTYGSSGQPAHQGAQATTYWVREHNKWPALALAASVRSDGHAGNDSDSDQPKQFRMQFPYQPFTH